MPVWGGAALWGILAGSGLFIGLLGVYITRPTHSNIARVMSFGAGALLGVVSLQLVLSAQAQAGVLRTTLALLCGALMFSLVNVALARAGARNRKRCGECTPQENERDTPGSGRAIAIGTVIDAFPEGLILGIAAAHGVTPAAPVVAGFFLSNVPESLSGGAGMYLAGRSKRYILTVWSAAVFVTPLAAALGSVFFAAVSRTTEGLLEGVSGGILLAMAVETMIPEAFDKAPLFSGTIAVLGFATIAALASLQ